jgi:hypothetical protein
MAQFPVGSRGFCLLRNVCTGTETHTTLYSIVTIALPPGVKRSGREADYSLPSSGVIKNVWSSNFTPLYTLVTRTEAFYLYLPLRW